MSDIEIDDTISAHISELFKSHHPIKDLKIVDVAEEMAYHIEDRSPEKKLKFDDNFYKVLEFIFNNYENKLVVPVEDCQQNAVLEA